MCCGTTFGTTRYDQDPRVERVVQAYLVTAADDDGTVVYEVIHTHDQAWTIRLADLPGRPLLDVGDGQAVDIPTAEQAIAQILGDDLDPAIYNIPAGQLLAQAGGAR